MESKTSDAIVNAILTQLKEDDLGTNKLLDLGVDGTSVNVGIINSVTSFYTK